MTTLDTRRPLTERALYVLLIVLGFICSVGSRECSKNCRECGSEGKCETCKAKYYGEDCLPCSPRCKYSLCVPGKCNDGCVKGWYGDYCDKNCTHCEKGCDDKGECKRDEEAKPKKKSWTNYWILVSILSFAALGVLAIVTVFVAEKKFPYTRCRVSTCLPQRKKKPPEPENKPPEEILWKRASALDDNISKRSSDEIIWKRRSAVEAAEAAEAASGLFVTPRTRPVGSDVRYVPAAERVPLMNTSSDVHIFVSPPTPKSSHRQKDETTSRISLFPPKRKVKTKMKDHVIMSTEI